MRMQDHLEEKIKQTFSPDFLQVENQSHLHAGHAGDDGSGESHFKLHIVSNAFSGLSRVARHKLVYELLETELKEHIHALALDLKTVEEHKIKS